MHPSHQAQEALDKLRQGLEAKAAYYAALDYFLQAGDSLAQEEVRGMLAQLGVQK